jgi:hypothetical protein
VEREGLPRRKGDAPVTSQRVTVKRKKGSKKYQKRENYA